MIQLCAVLYGVMIPHVLSHSQLELEDGEFGYLVCVGII